MDSGAAYSLKQRLVAGVLAVVATVWLATAAYSYFDARHEVGELLDAHLAQSAGLIVAQVGHDLEEIDVEHAAEAGKRARRVAFQIWDRGGTLRLRSADAPQSRLSPREEGYADATVNGRPWRVFSTWDARHRFLVQIGERSDARREIAAGIATSLLVPLGIALPLIAFFAWLGIARALRPLSSLGRQVAQRKADDLRPLAPAGIPREVLPLVQSLNALLERVARLLEDERRFTADAAHELRTPLAALKTQAQVARSAADPEARQRALDHVIDGCDRAARLVDQLLTLARLEPDAARPVERCDLAALARQAIADVASFAVAREVEIELRASEPAWMQGHPDLLSVLLRNLVDNAVRYSPRGRRVEVGVERTAAGARVMVEDQGRGIAPADRARLGERFYRVLGTGQTGVGLGLSIVRRIADIHSAAVRFDEAASGSGLRVTVTFPEAAA